MKLKKLLSLGLVSMFVAGFPISANALETIYTIQGKDKYETAALIADEQNYTTAILINADSTMADGLSASGLAGATNAPILLTKKNDIPNVTLKRVEKAKKVYIIGGESSIDKSTENILKNKNIEVKRLQGSDRIKTSYNVAKEINSINKVNKVILTNAFKGEPDAMSVACVAVRDKAPIVLTDGKSVPFNTTGIESYAIGGTSSMSDKLVNDTNSTRLGGVDRYDTNKKIVNKFYNGAKEFYIASGTDLVYALVGSTVAKDNAIVLVDNDSNKSVLKSTTKLTAIGNLSDSVLQQCLNVTKNIGNSDTGKEYTVEDAANIVKDLLGAEKIYFNYEFKKGESSIFLIDKNFEHSGKQFYMFGFMTGNTEGDVRYCVEKNDMSKVYTYSVNGVMEVCNPDDYKDTEMITEEKAKKLALEECARRHKVDINNLVVDMIDFRDDIYSGNVYAVRIDSKYDAGTYGWYFIDAYSGYAYKDIWNNI
ncbi:cell wall-binding repeat-containing protein [Clostridioides difficile]|uniref:cell wall-binding repeat-containing protein n=1 Tax=Clostridioides difficile TaxID=1496 RepID=UPI001FAD9A56|nr:cell wall-binding repeat-containing protein [Clostridioides difficile]MCJ0224516.1 cell wall-binding repeat-containing protein [Clostridioides difficile]MCJ0429258.1 cell wall-binding repeat-containing protein [Clostridioides difficile]MCJ0437350.1 cell wall-binding repeat-containing protein [Clostridioides difficile]MCU6150000.1 cell wall-binding repeat-containing protein [Clostridioides difficile]